jgi:putative transcriptional regulator
MSDSGSRAALAQRLKKGLLEGIGHARGERTLQTHLVSVPEGRDYSGEDVVALRQRYGLSQASFARYLMVSVKTLQSWEQGARKPSRATMRLLQVFDQPDEFAALLKR